jgi:hypothetical protein
MDFSFSEEQVAIGEVAKSIFGASSSASADAPPPPTGEDWLDRSVWAKLSKGNLLGTGLSSDVGGSGLGLLETCMILQEQGKHLGRVPAIMTLAVAAPAIDQFGSSEVREALLPRVVDGDCILSAALVEARSFDDADLATTVKTVSNDSWRLDGEKICVPFAKVSDRILVPAKVSESETAVVVVDPTTEGVYLELQETTNGQPEYRVVLDNVSITEQDFLGGPGERADVYRWLLERATVATCAVQLGVTEQVLAMTAAYTSQREQFGHPIAMFQAVALRAADAYLAVECIRSTMWQAAWTLAEGRDASQAIHVAKFWASEAGERVTAAGQQLHGGMGVDTDYPLHRYTFWSKHNELSLGSGHAHLAKIGAALAAGSHA